MALEAGLLIHVVHIFKKIFRSLIEVLDFFIFDFKDFMGVCVFLIIGVCVCVRDNRPSRFGSVCVGQSAG